MRSIRWCGMRGLSLLLLLGVATTAWCSDTRKFTVPEATRQGLLGFSTSLHGNVGFAGAPAGTNSPGMGYLFDLATGETTHTLLPSVSRADDLFGFNAKISETRLLVGDPGNPYAADRVPGAAYVFDVATGAEQLRLLPEDSFDGDEFGFGINLDGDLAIIGAPHYETGSGAAYLFDLGSGAQLQKLIPTDPLFGSDFGADVAVNADFAVVGAPGAYDLLGYVPGAAYVFDVDTGQQLFKLEPSDGFGGDEFGFDVAVEGNRAIIGAPNGGADEGAAYVFDLFTGEQLHKLVPLDRRQGDNFGGSVDLDGGRALIGASALGDRDLLGAAYVFDVVTGRQLTQLRPSDVARRDSFGESVDLDGDRVFVGAPQNDDTNLNAGAAYLFELELTQDGDFNRDGRIDVQDIDLLTVAVQEGTHAEIYDLNQDELVDQADRVIWVEQIANTYFGDADLDGQFDSSDFVLVMQSGLYEDDVSGNAMWTTGDWDGNADFGTEDFILAMQSGGYEQGPRATAVAAVPEPHGWALTGMAGLGLLARRRRRKRSPTA